MYHRSNSAVVWREEEAEELASVFSPRHRSVDAALRVVQAAGVDRGAQACDPSARSQPSCPDSAFSRMLRLRPTPRLE